MTPEEKSGREKAMQELREWSAKKEAERKAKGIPELPEPPLIPTVIFEPLEEVKMSDALPTKPFIRFIRTFQDAPEGDRQDFEFKSRLGGRSIQDKIEEDSEETGCTQYVVLREDDQYCVWRMPR